MTPHTMSREELRQELAKRFNRVYDREITIDEAIEQTLRLLDTHIEQKKREARIDEVKNHWHKLHEYHDWVEPYFEDRLEALEQEKS